MKETKVPLERTLLLGERVSKVDKLLSGQECQDLIQLAIKSGFKKSPVSGGGHGRTGREDARTNEYTVVVDQSLADTLYLRIKDLLPQNLAWMIHSIYFDREGGAAWSIAGVVERLRFYKYDRYEEYPEHQDGAYKRDVLINGELYHQQSFLTLLIYLNEDFTAGETKFFPDRQHCRFLRDIEVKEPVVSIKPKTGSAVVNVHNILHEGSAPTSGTKYVLRTDVIYQKRALQHPKLRDDTLSLKNKKKNEKNSVVVSEWNKIFEPSCKMYHD
eukprot:TRINITY_DN2252_c0_g1_i1.p1 TRINITY_DN2252_c0_g1~~TRINITY_DN2252_c0_g1_i1.p1  ORF type:complete len:272 (+),score=73.18 TRINITY_DN2252_c0_g1_i1:94-909(+)